MTTQKLATVAAIMVALTLAQSGRSDIVYNNTSTDLNTRFNPGTNEIGDEIFLGGNPAARRATTFSFEYYGVGFSGNEQARVRFYLNDGTILGIARAPGTLFFDSGPFSITPTARATLNFDLSGQNLTLPNNFTWTVSFGGITAGESAGVDIYDPPTIGNNLDDAWLRAGNGSWGLITNSNPAIPLTFGARFDAVAVPEPTVWTLSIIGGLFGLVLLRRRKS